MHAILPVSRPPSIIDAGRADVARRPPRVLFALAGAERPSASLRRARALSIALGARLHVVVVVPNVGYLNPLLPYRKVVYALEDLGTALETARATRAWLAEVLGGDGVGDLLEIRTGAFVEQIVRHAMDLAADLIVIGPRDGMVGATVSALALEAHVPVLVARDATSVEAIVAGTDLADQAYPVLRTAAELGLQLHAPVIAVHNVPSVIVTRGTGGPPHVLEGRAMAEARKARLAGACAALRAEAQTIVANENSAADAILHEARARDADIVVVGARAHRWYVRLLGSSVAAEVVDRAQRSVLVTPIGPQSTTAGGLAAHG